MNGHNRRRLTSAAALLIALVAAPGAMSWSADVALPNGQPDPSCEDLRLWLRADAGVRDADGRRPSDAGFSGTVASWSDQSERHFDLAAPSAQAPYYVMSAPGAGAPPTIAFGSGRTLARREDALHDQVNSTTLLVLKIEPSKEQGSTTFSTGELGGMWESLSFDRLGGSDAAQDYVHWTFPTTDREYQLTVPLQLATDGRFTLVTLRSANERSSLEVQNGLGDFFGANREFVPQGVSLLSNQCGPGYSLGGPALAGRLLGGPALAGRLLAAPGLGGQWLGGAALAGGGRGRLRGGGVLAGRRGRGQAQTQTGYDAQVAEVLVYNRDLPSADRRKLTAYLRSKYQLDVLDALFPAGAMLLQAEDFDGPWKIAAGLDPLGPTSLGHGPVVSPEVESREQGAGSREPGLSCRVPSRWLPAPRSLPQVRAWRVCGGQFSFHGPATIRSGCGPLIWNRAAGSKQLSAAKRWP